MFGVAKRRRRLGQWELVVTSWLGLGDRGRAARGGMPKQAWVGMDSKKTRGEEEEL